MILQIWKKYISKATGPIGDKITCPIEDEMQFIKNLLEIAGNNFILHSMSLMQPGFCIRQGNNYEQYFEHQSQENCRKS